MSANLQHSIQNSSTEGVKIVSLAGEIDESNQASLEQLMTSLIEDESVQNIVIDVEKLDYINSGVIGLFATFHGQFTETGKSFVFSQANEHIFDIIDLVGLTSVVECFETIEDACLSFEN
jgi:stage II sporulation protein AA (anti-sigma F factor antagonist)